MVKAECLRQRIDRKEFRCSRRDVRAHTGWGDTQLRVHLGRLEELKYLLAHRGGRGQSFVYELVFSLEGEGGRPMLAGLIDVDKLTGKGYDGDFAGLENEVAAQSGPGTGRSRVGHGASQRQCSCGFHRASMQRCSTGLNPPMLFANRS